LTKGVTLTIPDQAANSAQTFKVYNESEVIGSASPEIYTVAKKKKWWQTLIQILIIMILVIAVIVTAGAAQTPERRVSPKARSRYYFNSCLRPYSLG
jgi:hypothetical protein